MTLPPASGVPPFSIRVFVPDGDPEGLRIIDKTNWSGCGVVFPRALLPAIIKTRKEAQRTGVYILLGSSGETDMPRIYIGEGDPVGPRLEQHHRNKEFWTSALFFVSQNLSLNKAHVQYLESRLLDLAKSIKRVRLDNANTPTPPSLSEPEQAAAETFLQDVLSICPLLGVTAFERPKITTSHQERLYLKAKKSNATGQGYETTQGFVVLEGARAARDQVKSIHKYMGDLRQTLIHEGVLVLDGNNYRLTQEYAFSSPSLAAGVLLGRSANGRIEWKRANGKTLKKIQEESTSANGDTDTA